MIVSATLVAASTDPEAARVWQDLQQERLCGMSMFAKALDEAGHLRPGVSVAEARDVLWTYNSAELYQLLVIERKWSAKRYGRWIADALTAALLVWARGTLHGAQLWHGE